MRVIRAVVGMHIAREYREQVAAAQHRGLAVVRVQREALLDIDKFIESV